MDNLEKKVKIACIQALVVEYFNKKLFGDVLTVIDCSESDVESRKARKSLISQAFSRDIKQFLFELNNLKEVD